MWRKLSSVTTQYNLKIACIELNNYAGLLSLQDPSITMARAFASYIHNLFQITCSKLNIMGKDLKRYFQTAIKTMHQSRPTTKTIPSHTIVKFESRLRKKMLHARLNTFINNHYEKEAKLRGKTSKGSFTLRDDLYAIVRKRKQSS